MYNRKFTPNKIKSLEVLKPPQVEPAQPPKNINIKIIDFEKIGQLLKSAVA